MRKHETTKKAWAQFFRLRKEEKWPQFLPVKPESFKDATGLLSKFHALHRAASLYEFAFFGTMGRKTADGYSAFLGFLLAWSSYNAFYNVPWDYPGLAKKGDGEKSRLVLPWLMDSCGDGILAELTARTSTPLEEIKRHLTKDESFKDSFLQCFHRTLKNRIIAFLQIKSSIKQFTEKKQLETFLSLAYAIRNSAAHGYATPSWFRGTKTSLGILKNIKLTLLYLTETTFCTLVLKE